MKYIFAAVYALVLITQLPHVWYAYAALEAPDLWLAHWTAVGAALAFELSTGVFTYRIVRGSRRRWTKRGLWFFIVASVVANGFYYDWWPFGFARIWPVFATVALPLALALFAEEFGAEERLQERREQRAKRKETPTDSVTVVDSSFTCSLCGRSFATQNGLNGHMRSHNKEPAK